MTEDLDEIDDEQEAADNEWFANAVIIPLRRSIVRSLLAGNDTQCFTTEQYKAAYEKETQRISKTSLPVMWDAIPGGAARHLQSTGLVEEVETGIWRAKHDQLARVPPVQP